MENWSFAQVWNNAMREEWEAKPRNYLWASELGKAPIDVIKRMKGHKPTNPANDRAKRKFEAGNMAEWIVGSVLKRAGILVSDQKYAIQEATDTTLKVTGRADFIAGGKIDTEQAMMWLGLMEAAGLPEIFALRGEAILKHLQEKFPNGLPEKPLEIKSLSGMMFELFLTKGTASKNHRMQLYHYMKCLGYTQGDVVYISRDDLRIAQVPIYISDRSKDDYEKAIATLSHYYLNDIMPEKEKEIVWDDDIGKLVANWNVRYSEYLTELYGYENTEAYDNAVKSTVARWNRVLGRVKNGDKMTDKNLEAIKEMEAAGFEPKTLAPNYATGANDEDTMG
jgi:hypothetical protein